MVEFLESASMSCVEIHFGRQLPPSLDRRLKPFSIPILPSISLPSSAKSVSSVDQDPKSFDPQISQMTQIEDFFNRSWEPIER
jgi:hypothetical protein